MYFKNFLTLSFLAISTLRGSPDIGSVAKADSAVVNDVIETGSLGANQEPGNVLVNERYFQGFSQMNWGDNSEWMGTATSFSLEDTATDGRLLVIGIEGSAQFFLPVSGMKSDTIYEVEMEARCVGQIEKMTPQFRMVPHPWHNYGSIEWQPSESWTTWRMQARVVESELEHLSTAAFFMRVQGVGTIEVRSVRVRELDAFILPEVEHASFDEILLNDDFLLGLNGWVPKGEVSLESDNNQITVTMPKGAYLTSEEGFSLAYQTDYQLTVETEGDVSGLQLSISRLSTGMKVQTWNFKTTDGLWETTYTPSLPTSGALIEDSRYWLRLGATQGTAARIKRISIRNTLGNELASQRPRASFEVKLQPSSEDHYLSVNDPVELTVYVAKPPAVVESTELIISNQRGETVAQHSLSIDELPDAQLGAMIDLTGIGVGWYSFSLSINGDIVESIPYELGILPELPESGDDVNDYLPYMGSHHFDMFSSDRKNAYGWSRDISLKSDNKLALGRLLGFRSVRTHPPLFTKWWYIEPEKGVWRLPDDMVEEVISHDMSVLGMLDGTAKYASTAPESVLNQDRDWLGWGSYPPADLEDWRRYVRTIVTHYQNQITEWEVWNEADHIFFNLNPNESRSKAEVYVELVRAAYEEVKAIDPNIQVIAGSATQSAFLKEIIGLGVLDYCDGLSMHFYGAALSGANGTGSYDRIIDSINGSIRDGGQSVPIWDSESCVSAVGVAEGLTGYKVSQTQLKSIISGAAAGLERYYLYSAAPKAYPGHDAHRMVFGYAGRPLILGVMTATFDRLLNTTRIDHDLSDSDRGIDLFTFSDKAERRVLVGWSQNAEQMVSQQVLTEGVILDAVGTYLGEFSEGNLPLGKHVRYFIRADAPALDLFENQK